MKRWPSHSDHRAPFLAYPSTGRCLVRGTPRTAFVAVCFSVLSLSARATPDAGPADAAAEVPASSAAKEVAFADHYPRERAFPLRGWLRQHGLKGGGAERMCWELNGVVGVPPADGVLCLRDEPRTSRRFARVYRVNGRKVQTVF